MPEKFAMPARQYIKVFLITWCVVVAILCLPKFRETPSLGVVKAQDADDPECLNSGGAERL
jgi:hypothetical protein